MTFEDVKNVIEKNVRKGIFYETTFANSLSDILKESSYLLYDFKDSTEECFFSDDVNATYTKSISPLYYSRVIDNSNNLELLDIILSEVPYYYVTPSANNSILEDSLSETRDAGIDNVPSIMHENDFYQTWFRDSYSYIQNKILLDVYNKLRYPYVNENQYLDANIFTKLAKTAFNNTEDSESKISFETNDTYLSDLIDQKVISNYSYIDYSSEQADFLTNVIESYYQSGQFDESQCVSERLVFKLQEVKNELLRRKLSGTYTLYKLVLANMNRNGSFIGIAKASDITPYDSFAFNENGDVVAVNKSVNEERPVRIVNIPGITTSTITRFDETIDPIYTYYIAPDEYNKMPLKMLNSIFYTSADIEDSSNWDVKYRFDNEKFYTLGSVAANNRLDYTKENFEERAAYDSYFLRDNANIIPWTALEGVTSQQNIAEYPDTLDMYEEKDGIVRARTLDSYITNDDNDDKIRWHLDNSTSMISLKSIYSNALDINADRPLYHYNSLQRELGSYYDYLTYPIANGNGVCLMDSFWLNYLEYQLSSKTKVNDTTLFGVQINRYVDLSDSNYAEYDFFGIDYADDSTTYKEAYEKSDPPKYIRLWYCTITYDTMTMKYISFNKILISKIVLHSDIPGDFKNNDSIKSEYVDCEPYSKYNIGVLPFTYKGLYDENVDSLKLGFYEEDDKHMFYDDASIQGFAKAMFVFSEYDVTRSAIGKDVDPCSLSSTSMFKNDFDSSLNIKSLYYVVSKNSKEEYVNVTSNSGSPVYDNDGNLVVSTESIVYRWSDPINVVNLQNFDFKAKSKFTPDWYGLTYHLNPYLNFTTQSASALRHKDALKANIDTQWWYDKKSSNLPLINGPSSQTALSNLARMRRLDFTANDLGEHPTNWTHLDVDLDHNTHKSEDIYGMYLKKVQETPKSNSYKLSSNIYGDNRDDDLYDLPYFTIRHTDDHSTIPLEERKTNTLYIESNSMGEKSYWVWNSTSWLSISVEDTKLRSNIYYNEDLTIPAISVQEDTSDSSSVVKNHLMILPSRDVDNEPDSFSNWYWHNSSKDGITICMNFMPSDYHVFKTADGGAFEYGNAYYSLGNDGTFSPVELDDKAIDSGYYVKTGATSRIIIEHEGEFSIEAIPADNKDAIRIRFSYSLIGEDSPSQTIETEDIDLSSFAKCNHRLSASACYFFDETTPNVQMSLILDDTITSNTFSIDKDTLSATDSEGHKVSLQSASSSAKHLLFSNKIPKAADTTKAGISIFSDKEGDRQFFGDILDLRLYNSGYSKYQLPLLNRGMFRELYSYGPSVYKLAQTIYKDPGIFKIVDNDVDNQDIKHIGAVRIFNRSVWDSILIDNFPVSEEEMDPDSPQFYPYYRNPKYDIDVYSRKENSSETQLDDCVEQTLLDRVEVLNGREIKQLTKLEYYGESPNLNVDDKISIVLATIAPISYVDSPIEDRKTPQYVFNNVNGKLTQNSPYVRFFLKADASDDYFKYSADFSPNFIMDDSFNLASWLTRGSNISLVYDKTKNDSYAVLADDSIRSSESNCIVVPLMIPYNEGLEDAYFDRLNISNFRLSGEFSRLLKATSYYSELRIPMACKRHVKDYVPAKDLEAGATIRKYYVDAFEKYEGSTYTEHDTYYIRYGSDLYSDPFYYVEIKPKPTASDEITDTVYCRIDGQRYRAKGLFANNTTYYKAESGEEVYNDVVIGKEIPALYEKNGDQYQLTDDASIEADKTYYNYQLTYKSGYYNKWDGIRALKEGTYYFTCKYPIRFMPFNDNEFDASIKGSLATIYASTRFKIEVSSSAKELTIDDETAKYSISNMPSKYNADNIVDTLKSSNELIDPEDNRTFPHREVSIKLYALDVPVNQFAGKMNEDGFTEEYGFTWKLIGMNDADAVKGTDAVLLDKTTVEQGCLIGATVPMFFSKNFTMPFFIAGQVKVEDDENFITNPASADDDLIEPIKILSNSSKEKITALSADDTDHLVLIAGKTYKILFDYTAKVSEFAYTNERFSDSRLSPDEKLICSRYYSLIDSLGILDHDFAYTTDGDSFKVPENFLDVSMGVSVKSDGGFESPKSCTVDGNDVYYIGDPTSRVASKNILYSWMYPQNSSSARYNLENSYKIHYLSQFANEIVSLHPTSKSDKPIARLRIEDFKAFDNNGSEVTVHGFSENAILKQQYLNMIDVDSLMEIQSTAYGLISGFSKVKPYIRQNNKPYNSYTGTITSKSHELYAYNASSRTMPYVGPYSITRTSLFRNNLLKGKQLDYLNDKYWTVTGIYDEASYVDDEEFGKAVVKASNVSYIDLYYDGGEYLLNSKYEAAINLKADKNQTLDKVNVTVYYYDNAYNELTIRELYCDNKSSSIWNYHAQLSDAISASKIRFYIEAVGENVDILIGKAIVRGNGTSTMKVGLASTYYGGANADGSIVVSSHSIPVLKDISNTQYLPIQFKNRAMNAYSTPRPNSGINRAALFISENISGNYGITSKIDRLELPWVRRLYFEKGYSSDKALAYFHKYDIKKDLLGYTSYEESYKESNDLFTFTDAKHPEYSFVCDRDKDNDNYIQLHVGNTIDDNVYGIEVELDSDNTLSYYGNNLIFNGITMDNERLGLTYNCFNLDAVRDNNTSLVAVTNIQLLNNLIENDAGTYDDREVLYELEYLPIIYDESKHHLSMNILLKRGGSKN